jgi:hypothetical protein
VHLGIGQTAVGVDGGVDVGIADAGPGLGGVLVLNALDPPATALRYAGLLFDVDMDQLAGASGLDAPDHPAVAVEVGQPAHPVALQHPVECRGRDADPRGQAGRPELVTPSELDDPPFHPVRGLGGAASRTAGAVLQAGNPCVLVALPPLVSSLAGDPHGFCCCGDGPAVLVNQLTQTESTFRGERSVTVHGEPSWLCGCVNSSTLPWGLTSSGDSPRQQRPWAEQLGTRAVTGYFSPGESA